MLPQTKAELKASADAYLRQFHLGDMVNPIPWPTDPYKLKRFVPRAARDLQYSPQEIKEKLGKLLETLPLVMKMEKGELEPHEMPDVGVDFSAWPGPPLYRYQENGVTTLAWLLQQHKCAILADEMGLGKTFQILALILCFPPISNGKPSLIVVPAGVEEQWEKAVAKANIAEQVLFYSARNKVPDGVDFSDYKIVITTLSFLANQFKPLWDLHVNWDKITARVPDAPLFFQKWSLVANDEVHKLQNPDALRSRAMASLLATFFLGASGTPYQNEYISLYSEARFLDMAPLNSRPVFEMLFIKKKSGRTQRSERLVGDVRALFGSCFRAIMVHRRHRLIPQTTGDPNVAGLAPDMPPLTIQDIELTLSPDEMEYQEESARLWEPHVSETRRQIYAPEEDEVEYLESLDDTDAVISEDASIFQLLIHAQLSLVHPMCVSAAYGKQVGDNVMKAFFASQRGTRMKKEEEKLLDEFGSRPERREKLKVDLRDQGAWSTSSLLKAASDLVKKILNETSDDKILVFCERLSAADCFTVALEQKGIDSRILHGGLNFKETSQMCKDFFEEPSFKVMLITSAAAEGIDLYIANHIIILTLTWNPQKEWQVIFKEYRIGQKKPVFAYRFICPESIQAFMISVQRDKIAKSNSLMDRKQQRVNAEWVQNVGYKQLLRDLNPEAYV